jgi:signal transduction histidine kinase
MHRPQWLKVSLARKMSVLLGTAVLLTIAATLFFPWQQMTFLHEQALLAEAQRIAGTARQAVDLTAPDWTEAQRALNELWPPLAHEHGLPPQTPQLIVANLHEAQGMTSGLEGFRAEAIRHLRRHPRESYFWRTQNEGTLFRLALAVRGLDTDPHPDVLRGIIDVRLPVVREVGIWNAVITVLAGASGAVLAILVFYLVTQRLVLSKVNALRHVAEQVTVGHIDVRAGITSGDEFQQFATAFNDMLTHLNAAQDNLKTINRSLDTRLGELAETNIALYESNRMKSEFLSNVSHELRTPLVSIIGFAELLRDAWQNGSPDSKRMIRFAENILTSGRSLLEIINDLLDLAKIEAGKMELHLSEFSIAELFQDLVDFVRPLADRKQQQLSLEIGATATGGGECGPDLPTFHSDSGKIKQILYNLLSNAIKFTPSGGAVRITVAAETTSPSPGASEPARPHAGLPSGGTPSGFVRLAVIDTGPGIPPDQQALIFEKFLQLDASRTREHEGTGLGLAITSSLVEILGGTIEVHSTPGEGATFTVRLPPVAPQRVYHPKVRL